MSVIDTLSVMFTADIQPLTARLNAAASQLSTLSAVSEYADRSLRALGGSINFAVPSLKAGARSAGAQVSDAFAAGIRSRKGVIDAAVKYATSSALSSLRAIRGMNLSASSGYSGAQVLSGTQPSQSRSRYGDAQSIVVPINIDGVKLGEACVKAMSKVGKLTGRQ